MKTIKINLVSLFLIFAFFWISVEGNSQGLKPTRQELKEVRKAQLAANFNILDSLLQSRSFVLEADYLMDRYGYRILVVPDLNFIKVDVLKGILQTGFSSNIGYNGIGGVTAEGNVGAWKIFKDFKHMSYRVEFTLNTNIGIYDISMNISAANRATATITGLGPGRLTWEGHLVTINNSRVFKGQNTF